MDAEEMWTGWATAQRARGLADETIRSRRTYFWSWCEWIGDGFDEATHVDLEAWIADHGASWAAETRKRAFSDVANLYRWARREGITTANPSELAWSPRVPRRLPRPAPADAITRALSNGHLLDRRAVALMYYGGLRCCEVAALRWGDVDLGAGTMYVVGKGNQTRVVWINRLLSPWLAQLDGSEPHAPVVPGRRGGAVGRATISRRVSAHLVGTLTGHQLRHSFATTLLDSCRDITVVQAQLGHANVATTQGYAAVSPNRIRQGALSFEELSLLGEDDEGDGSASER